MYPAIQLNRPRPGPQFVGSQAAATLAHPLLAPRLLDLSEHPQGSHQIGARYTLGSPCGFWKIFWNKPIPCLDPD